MWISTFQNAATWKYKINYQIRIMWLLIRKQVPWHTKKVKQNLSSYLWWWPVLLKWIKPQNIRGYKTRLCMISIQERRKREIDILKLLMLNKLKAIFYTLNKAIGGKNTSQRNYSGPWGRTQPWTIKLHFFSFSFKTYVTHVPPWNCSPDSQTKQRSK